MQRNAYSSSLDASTPIKKMHLFPRFLLILSTPLKKFIVKRKVPLEKAWDFTQRIAKNRSSRAIGAPRRC